MQWVEERTGRVGEFRATRRRIIHAHHHSEMPALPHSRESASAFSSMIQERVPCALELYLKEVGAEELLTSERETELGRAIQAGCATALEQLVRANCPFAVSVARRYQGRGLDLEDLIQEANIGLMIAARKFDPDRGVRFISHAVWWIRQRIQVALEQRGRTVRISHQMHKLLKRVVRTRARLRQLLFREPTAAEIAEAIGMDRDEVELVEVLTSPEVPLNGPREGHADDPTREFLETLVAEDAVSDPAAEWDRKTREGDAHRALETLPPHYAHVLRLLYGMEGEEYNPREIGELLGVSRQRVEDMKKRALERARDTLAPAPRVGRRPAGRTEEHPMVEGDAGRLTDAQWALVSPLLPDPSRRADLRGRQPTPPRNVLDGILWMLRTDSRWQDIPAELAPTRACYNHLRQWTDSGIMEQVLGSLMRDLKARGGYDLRECVARGLQGAPSWQAQTAQLLLSPATVRLLHRVGSSLLAEYPSAAPRPLC
jgi:RNA polymerase primary sigma factor